MGVYNACEELLEEHAEIFEPQVTFYTLRKPGQPTQVIFNSFEVVALFKEMLDQKYEEKYCLSKVRH